MPLFNCWTTALTLLAVSAFGSTLPQCDENVKLDISASALNKLLPDDALKTGLNQSQLAALPDNPVSGTYTIAGRYCKPAVDVASRRSTLQLLVHGITYDRNYWSGMGPPADSFNGTTYSWIDYASQQGYPTFSVDRICNGASSHPEGLLVCQNPMNAAVLAGVVKAAKAGSIGNTTFEKVVYVGHSEGSFIGNSLAQLYPDVVDTYVLTAFTKFLILGAVGTFGAGVFLPAAVVDASRFGKLSLDPTYLLATNEAGVTGFFYDGDFVQEVAQRDFDTRGTVPTGEFATALLGQLPAPKFTGSVLTMTGENDQIVCSRSLTDPLVGYKGNCGTGDSSYTAQTQSLYPNAKTYQYHIVPNTGHDMNFHYSAQETFMVAHEFLASEGY